RASNFGNHVKGRHLEEVYTIVGRPPRFCPENSTHHIIARCHNRQFLFQQEADFETYRHLLRKYKEKFPFKLYNYQLMSNHVHLICGIGPQGSISRIMHAVSPAYAKWYNDEYHRRGAFWGHRFKNILVEDRRYYLELSRYIDLNMVRA